MAILKKLSVFNSPTRLNLTRGLRDETFQVKTNIFRMLVLTAIRNRMFHFHRCSLRREKDLLECLPNQCFLSFIFIVRIRRKETAHESRRVYSNSVIFSCGLSITLSVLRIIKVQLKVTLKELFSSETFELFSLG